MRRNAALAVVAIGFALFALAGPSRSASEEASPLAHGIVKGIDAKAERVTLDHEDIPGVMMAMTMAYGVVNPALLSKVEVGQAVDFRLGKDGDGNYVVTEIEPAEQKTKTARDGGGMSCCDSCEGAGCGNGQMHHGMTGGDEHHGMKH
jgi:Cu(I)/Ag(I) efflux system periplasmic protein CusF